MRMCAEQQELRQTKEPPPKRRGFFIETKRHSHVSDADALAALQSFDELWKNLVYVSNNSKVCNTEDGCFLVFVDGDDVL